MARSGSTTPALCAARWGLAAVLVLFGAGQALAQVEGRGENPVFVDESPATSGSLARVREFIAARNDEQAVRLLQKLLDEHAEEVVPSEADENLFEPLRGRVHALLLGLPDLLARYRELMGPGAADMLKAGRYVEVERTRFLTPAGVDATLALARTRLLNGEIDGAVLTIQELADHPDKGKKRAEIGAVATLIGPYVKHEATRAALGELAEAAMPAKAEVPPAVAALPSITGGAPALNTEGLVSRPLGTAVFGDDRSMIRPLRWNGNEAALEQFPPFGREMRVWPAVGARAVVVASGQTVAAYDRITLRELWRHEILGETGHTVGEDGTRLAGGLRSPPTNTWEECTQPTIAGQTVLAVVGIDLDGNNSGEGDEYLASFDIDSGAVRWVKKLSEIDGQLTKAFSRGAIVCDGRVAVISFLKRQPERRLLAALLVAVDPFTGERLWTRLVGSAGALPFYGMSRSVDMAVGAEGIVYRSDRLGVVGAYRMTDGRPLWVRRLGSKVLMEMAAPVEPWLVQQPVATEHGLFLLTPDRDQVMQLNQHTGEILATRPIGDLREPHYLLRAGDYLAAVTEMQVATVPLAALAKGAVKVSGRFGGTVGLNIRGRVTVAGDRLLVPTTTGVTVLDPAEPSKMDRVIPLDSAGAVLSLPEGLLVADDARLHIYSTWAIASAHLKSQIAAMPDDAGPATELLTLADRADQGAELLPAADAAAGALLKMEASGSVAGAERCRARVIETLLGVVERSTGPAPAPGAAVGVRLDEAGVDGALQRVSAVAKSGKELAAYELVRGEVLERRGRAEEAAGLYQKVLADKDMSAAPYAGDHGAIRADAEAVDRLRRLMKTSGRGAYAAFDREFEGAAAGVSDAAGIDRLAKRYPVAIGLPALWLRSARASTDVNAQARALELGVQAAERIADAPMDVVGALNGELVENLMKRNLVVAAADALSRAKSRFPGAALNVGGQPLVLAEMEKTIGVQLASARRWPRVGPPLADPKPQVLEGWGLMEPLLAPETGVAPAFLVLQRGDQNKAQVALFGLPMGAVAGEAAAATAAPLQELWSSERSSEPWQLLRLDVRGAVFFIPDEHGAVLVRVDASTGRVAWRTEPFGKLFPNDPPLKFGRAAMNEKMLADGGGRAMSELVVVTDDRTLSMVERSGRCATLDAETGQVLWTERLPLTHIVDAAVVNGRLIAAGEFPQPQADGKNDRVALVDARTGAAISITPSPVEAVTWVRQTSRGDLLICGRGAIACVASPDLETGKPTWTLNGHPAVNNVEAWVVDDRLFVLNDDGALWEINTVSGNVPRTPVETQNRLVTRTPITAASTGTGVAFASGRGVALIAPDGHLAGVDAVNAGEGSVTPAPCDGGFVMLAPAATGSGREAFVEPGVTAFTAHRVDALTCALRWSTPLTLGTAPQRISLIDGRIAVTAGFTTVIYRAPGQ